MPSVSKPFLAWTTSGEIDFQEREKGQPWTTNRIRKGSLFLTTGGASYDVRWRAVNPEPFEAMLVFVELPVLERALEEVFGKNATHARLRDASAFDDAALNSLFGAVARGADALKILGSWLRLHMRPKSRVGGLAKKMKVNLRDVRVGLKLQGIACGNISKVRLYGSIISILRR